MVRIILGVVVGFIVWSILWIGSDQVLISLSPQWYGSHQYGFEDAMNNGKPFAPDSTSRSPVGWNVVVSEKLGASCPGMASVR